jgi:hypothetical protein
MTVVHDIWESMHDRVGEDLRVVTRYEGSDFQTLMREDVREQYDLDEDWEIVDQTILRQLSLDDVEAAFDAGKLQAQVWVFARAWVLTWPDRLPGKSGVIVSIERGGDATVEDVDAALEFLESKVARRLD